MKKIITYITILAAFAVVSCTRTDEAFETLNAPVLTISLNAGEMITKSAIPNVEDVVTQFDWFFYADNTGTSEPVYHGHYSVNGTTVTYVAGDEASAANADSDEIHLGFNLEDPKYKDITGSYYVYVLANYDGIDHATVANLTLEKLLEKTLDTNFDEESEGYTAINNFVMDSYSGDDESDYPQLISVRKATEDPEIEGGARLPVNLQRVAVKISFTLVISPTLEDANGSLWKPITGSSNFATYMVNTVNHATVAGEPVDADTNAKTGYNPSTGMGAYQTSYATKHVKVATDGDTGLEWEVDPFYSYPVSYTLDSNNAPYFKLQLPWENVDEDGNLIGMGATLYYYKAYLRDNEGKAITKLERNKHYIVTLNVNELGGTQEDYVELDTFYYVADWQSPSHMYDGYYAPRFLDIPEDVYYIYGDESITVALTSSHPISAEIVGTPSQKDINGSERITRISYNTQQDLYTLNISQIWYTDANTPQQRTETGTNTAKVTSNGKVSFTLDYQMNTTLSGHLMDLTPITWKLKVYHSDNEDVYDNVTIIQYPSIYLELNSSGAQGQTGYNGETTFLDSNRYSSTSTSTTYYAREHTDISLGSLGGGTPTSREKTVFTVSTLASLSNVVAYTKNGTEVKFSDLAIGDPRVRISSLWGKDALTHQGRTWEREHLGGPDDNIYGTDEYIDNYLYPAPNKSNFIAPRFMFASGKLGTCNDTNFNRGRNWRTAAERCAAYQEDGYPAGRWRLPTDAEVAFCRQIQANGYISGLFYSSNAYWAASGDYFQSGAINSATDESPASVRCVYDLWYWGEENYDNNRNQTGTAATVWLGYMTE